MNSNHIFGPVLAQIFLTLIMYIILGIRKTKVIKVGRVNRKQAALNNQVWSDDVVKVSNNIASQFEAPVLFYVLCLVLYSINAVSMVFIVLAWMFVLSRFAHAYVHIGSNHVPIRFRLFFIGCLLLISILILVAWEVGISVIVE